MASPRRLPTQRAAPICCAASSCRRKSEGGGDGQLQAQRAARGWVRPASLQRALRSLRLNFDRSADLSVGQGLRTILAGLPCVYDCPAASVPAQWRRKLPSQRPRQHQLDHVLRQLRKGVSWKWVSCFDDEDHVGQVCTLARACHAAGVGLRCLQRWSAIIMRKWLGVGVSATKKRRRREKIGELAGCLPAQARSLPSRVCSTAPLLSAFAPAGPSCPQGMQRAGVCARTSLGLDFLP